MTTDEMTRSLQRAEHALNYLSGWADLDGPERMELSAAQLAVRDVKAALLACPDCDGTGSIDLGEGTILRGSVTCPACDGTGVRTS